MSEEQLSALLAKLKEDAGLRERLKGVADLEALLAMVKEAGFDVSKADWFRYRAKQTLALSDEDLERVAGGVCDTDLVLCEELFKTHLCSLLVDVQSGRCIDC